MTECWQTDLLTECQTAWVNDWLTFGLPACLPNWHWLFSWLTNWLTDWLIYWLTDWLTDWLSFSLWELYFLIFNLFFNKQICWPKIVLLFDRNDEIVGSFSTCAFARTSELICLTQKQPILYPEDFKPGNTAKYKSELFLKDDRLATNLNIFTVCNVEVLKQEKEELTVSSDYSLFILINHLINQRSITRHENRPTANCCAYLKLFTVPQ